MKLLSLLFLGVISLTHSLPFLTFPTDSAEVWPSSFIDFPSSSRDDGEVAGSRICRHPELLGTGGRLQYLSCFPRGCQVHLIREQLEEREGCWRSTKPIPNSLIPLLYKSFVQKMKHLIYVKLPGIDLGKLGHIVTQVINHCSGFPMTCQWKVILH